MDRRIGQDSGWHKMVFALTLLTLSACHRREDPRFATARSTIDTLMSAYGVEGLTELEIQERLSTQQKFALKERNAMVSCFMDYAGAHDEGAAGFVFGRLAPKKDSLKIETEGKRARVFIEGQSTATATLLRERAGWRFSLSESVPKEVRARLREIYRRAVQMNKSHSR